MKIAPKNNVALESRFLENRALAAAGARFLRFWGVEVGSKNQLKIDLKMKSTWEGILASIFDRFWWIWGTKLGGKIEPRSMQKGIEGTIEKRTEARWPKKRAKSLRSPPTRRGRGPGESPPSRRDSPFLPTPGSDLLLLASKVL